jgi:hypothetical protein
VVDGPGRAGLLAERGQLAGLIGESLPENGGVTPEFGRDDHTHEDDSPLEGY